MTAGFLQDNKAVWGRHEILHKNLGSRLLLGVFSMLRRCFMEGGTFIVDVEDPLVIHTLFLLTIVKGNGASLLCGDSPLFVLK